MMFNTQAKKGNILTVSPLIHIGYHKTASSWMQQELFTKANDDFFNLTTRAKGNSSLAMHFVYDENRHLISPFKGASKTLEEELKGILKNNGGLNGKTPIISHERLSGNPHNGGFDSPVIAQRIYEYFPNAKILIMIREQKSWLLSNYYQYLKMGGNRKLTDYLNTKNDGKIPGFSPYYLEFHRLIQYYHNLFGKEQVLVLPQEMLKTFPEEFISRISSFIGRKIDTQPIRFDHKYNAKKHLHTLYKFRYLNAIVNPSSVNSHFVYSNKFTKRIASCLRQLLIKMTPESWNEKVASEMMQEIEAWSENRFESSNHKTQKIIGLNLEKFGYEFWTDINISIKPVQTTVSKTSRL